MLFRIEFESVIYHVELPGESNIIEALEVWRHRCADETSDKRYLSAVPQVLSVIDNDDVLRPVVVGVQDDGDTDAGERLRTRLDAIAAACIDNEVSFMFKDGRVYFVFHPVYEDGTLETELLTGDVAGTPLREFPSSDGVEFGEIKESEDD